MRYEYGWGRRGADDRRKTEGRGNARRSGRALLRRSAGVAAFLLAGATGTANAYIFNVGPNWDLSLNNTVTYTIGTRLKSVDPNIGNNPTYDDGDYKFDDAGDIVTDRVSILTELNANYKDKIGFRISADAFKDFAYDDDVKHHPGNAAPGVPYSSLKAYRNDEYSKFTQDHYIENIQILDAFVHGRTTIAGHTISAKVGQLSRFWGEAFFLARQAISYSQNSADIIKQVGAPGTSAKQLTIPRPQIDINFAITPSLQLEGEYFLKDDQDPLIAGGTYLGGADFLFKAPQLLNGAIPHGDDRRKTDWFPEDFGFRLAWSPLWLRGTAALYYRHFDESEPYALLYGIDDSGNLEYHQAYNKHVDMFAFSLSRVIDKISYGLELSYRNGTALPTTANPAKPTGNKGARGNTGNVILNAVVPLTPTPFYDTGTAIVEFGYTHLFDTTKNKDIFNTVDNPLTCPSGSRDHGCSTDNQVGVAASFDPQWIQVFPGVNFDLPLFAEYGIYGNPSTAGSFVRENGVFYTAGLRANIYNKYSILAQYHGYHFTHDGGKTSFQGAGGPQYYATGNGFFFFNDKQWFSLTFQAQF